MGDKGQGLHRAAQGGAEGTWGPHNCKTGSRDQQAEMQGRGRKEEAGLPRGSSWRGHRDPGAGRGVGQPLAAGRTHHWLSRGRAGSILSPTKGPGSAISVFVLLRLLEPCLRAALAFSSLQGEVRPYPSPSDGPARQTHVTASSEDRRTGWAPSFPHPWRKWREPAERARATSHHTGSPRAAPSPCSKQGQGREALGLLLIAVPQDRQGWVPTMPGLGSLQHLSPWKYFPGRFQKLREVW